MKKLLVVLSFGYLILCTGCGTSKKLDCTKNQSLYEMTANEEISFIFQGDKIESATLKLTMTIAESSIDQIGSVYKKTEEYYNPESKVKGIEIHIEKKDSAVVMNMKVSPTKSNQRKTGIPEYTDYETALSYLKKQGYQCK